MRLTEGLASVLKEQRPEYLPALLANYREHGVFQTQVRIRPPVMGGAGALARRLAHLWTTAAAIVARRAVIIQCPSVVDAAMMFKYSTVTFIRF